jgi:hypothetical protein
MTNDAGLKISMTKPTVEGYLGLIPKVQTYTENGITYDYTVPSFIVESGL